VDRLFIGVLGHRNSGKSYTWNTLFGGAVRTGSNARRLELRSGEFVAVFLISGSNEERDQYAGDVLGNQSARITLCSVQYVKRASLTLDYIEGRFAIVTEAGDRIR
jgi:UDP-N-acetylmuramyl tripeptide synthase